MSLRAALSCILCAAVIAASSPAVGQGPIAVQGTTGCEAWTGARSAGRAVPLEHYALGMLNGLSLGRRVEFWHADGPPMSRELAYEWIDRYCRANPRHALNAAVLRLFEQRVGAAKS